MKSIRSFTRVKILPLVVLAVGLSAGGACAQQLTGKFTLPVETRWGRAVLPAGDYTFSLEAASPHTLVIRRQTREFMAYVLPTGKVLQGPVAGHSQLLGIREGRTLRIRELRLAEADLTLGYWVPKAERPVMARTGPDLIQRVAIAMKGK